MPVIRRSEAPELYHLAVPVWEAASKHRCQLTELVRCASMANSRKWPGVEIRRSHQSLELTYFFDPGLLAFWGLSVLGTCFIATKNDRCLASQVSFTTPDDTRRHYPPSRVHCLFRLDPSHPGCTLSLGSDVRVLGPTKTGNAFFVEGIHYDSIPEEEDKILSVFEQLLEILSVPSANLLQLLRHGYNNFI